VTLEETKRAAILAALEQHQGNRTHTAAYLGIHIRTLQRRLALWNIHYGKSPHVTVDGPVVGK
jgi:DNA-binding NtrC family response regulator